MAAEAMGLTPMSPVMAEVGTVEIPVLARMTKLFAVPRLTGCAAALGGVGVLPPPLLAQALSESTRRHAVPRLKADDFLTIIMVGTSKGDARRIIRETGSVDGKESCINWECSFSTNYVNIVFNDLE
jgi:hypothetical protein